jgi:hypothetical protein
LAAKRRRLGEGRGERGEGEGKKTELTNRGFVEGGVGEEWETGWKKGGGEITRGTGLEEGGSQAEWMGDGDEDSFGKVWIRFVCFRLLPYILRVC